jgi:hypothetical protein
MAGMREISLPRYFLITIRYFSIFNNNTDLHNLIRKRLVLPYLTGFFTHLFLKNMQADF